MSFKTIVRIHMIKLSLAKKVVTKSSDTYITMKKFTRFNTFQKRIPRVPRIFCSSLELKSFDQKPNGDRKRCSVYSKICSHFHQRYSLFVALIIRSIRK